MRPVTACQVLNATSVPHRRRVRVRGSVRVHAGVLAVAVMSACSAAGTSARAQVPLAALAIPMPSPPPIRWDMLKVPSVSMLAIARVADVPVPQTPDEIRALCSQGPLTGDALRATFDAMASALESDSTPIRPFRLERYVAPAGDQLATLSYDGRKARLSVRDTLDGATLLHELTHIQLARLDPDRARMLTDLVLRADSTGGIPESVMTFAFASYSLVVSGRGPLLSQQVVKSVFESSFREDVRTQHRAGRLSRVMAATDTMVMAFGGGRRGQSVLVDGLRDIAERHWRFAGHRHAGWDWRDERAFILASEVVAYARESACSAPSVDATAIASEAGLATP